MRYRALRIVATVYRVIGWIIIVIGVLGTCASSVAAVALPSYVGGQFGYRAGAGVSVIQRFALHRPHRCNPPGHRRRDICIPGYRGKHEGDSKKDKGTSGGHGTACCYAGITTFVGP